jgi:polyphosphate glucokinase
MQVLGVDIGGSSIKAAPVDVATGELTAERLRLETPDRLAPERMAARLDEVVRHFAWDGPVGIGFPAAIRQGVALTAANIAPTWLGADLVRLFSGVCPGPLAVLNDADAAGLAEVRFGAGRGVSGTILLVTVGTGLGTALFTDGHLLPNTELGHLYLEQVEAEHYASDLARKRDGLSWEAWAGRFGRYLQHLERLFWPDLIIVGGGASYSFEKFADELTVPVPVRAAQLRNDAGVIGAALALVEAGKRLGHNRS